MQTLFFQECVTASLLQTESDCQYYFDFSGITRDSFGKLSNQEEAFLTEEDPDTPVLKENVFVHVKKAFK